MIEILHTISLVIKHPMFEFAAGFFAVVVTGPLSFTHSLTSPIPVVCLFVAIHGLYRDYTWNL